MPDAVPEIKDVPVAELYADTPAPTPVTETPTATPETSAAVTTEPVVETAPTPSLKDRVAELGFKDVADDNQAQQRLIEAYSQQEAYKQQMQQQMEMLRLQMQVAQQVPAQTAPATQPAAQGWWNAPRGNEQLRQQFVMGRAENGDVQWKPNTPQQVISEYEAEEAHYRDWANKLIRNPDQALKPFEDNILAAVERKIQETIESHQQRQQAETFVQQQLRDNEDVFYQKDPVTQQIRQDFQGQPMLTEAGVRFDSILGELERSGLKDETARWKYAQQIYKAQYGDFRQQNAQKIQQARDAHVAKTLPAVHVPARNGQDVNGREHGGRPHLQTMGERFLANHEISFS